MRGQDDRASCNCKVKDEYELNKEFMTKDLVYLAIIEAANQDCAYFVSTARTFKERLGGHKYNMKLKGKPGTTLSRKINELKDDQPPTPFQLKWTIANKCQHLSCGQPICDVCLIEENKNTAQTQRTTTKTENQLPNS